MVSTRRQKAAAIASAIREIDSACSSRSPDNAVTSFPSPSNSNDDITMVEEPSAATFDPQDKIPGSPITSMNQETSSNSSIVISFPSPAGTIQFPVSKPGVTVHAKVRLTKKVTKKVSKKEANNGAKPVLQSITAVQGTKRTSSDTRKLCND